jgi:hypothetical protein
MQGQLMLDAEEVAAMKRLHELGWGRQASFAGVWVRAEHGEALSS